MALNISAYQDPMCDSKHITNEYFLVVRIWYDACTCCSDNTASVRIPLTIIPEVDTPGNGFDITKEWFPIELGFIKIEDISLIN